MVTQQPLRRNRPIRSPLLLTGPAVPTKSSSYATRKNSPAVEAARSYLLNNQIADNYQKIFVALDPDLAASDYFSQYSEIYSQWLPKMHSFF